MALSFEQKVLSMISQVSSIVSQKLMNNINIVVIDPEGGINPEGYQGVLEGFTISPSALVQEVLERIDLSEIFPQGLKGLSSHLLLSLLSPFERQALDEALREDANADLLIKYTIAMETNQVIDPTSETFEDLMTSLVAFDIISPTKSYNISQALVEMFLGQQ